MSRKAIGVIIFFSACLAICLGLADRETQSLWQLFTGDGGNVVALAMYAALFSTVGIGMAKCLELSGRTEA